MKKISVGIIGCGGITQMAHLPYLRELDDRYEVAAVCDINRAVAEDVAAHYGIRQVHTDYRELVQAKVDAVMILSNGSHRPQILAALAAGKHIFTEKPLAFSMIEARQLDEAIRQSGLKVMVAYMKRYDPGYLYGREQIRAMKDIRFVQSNVYQSIDSLYREHYRIRTGGGKIATGPVLRPKQEEDETAMHRMVSEGEYGQIITAALGQAAPAKRMAYFQMMQSNAHDMNMIRGIFGDPLEVSSTEVWHSGLCFSSTLVFKPDFRVVMSWIYLPYQKNYLQEIACFGSDTRVRIQFPAPYLLHAPTPVTIQTEEDGMLVEKKVIASYDEAFQRELLAFYDWLVNGIKPETDHSDALADVHWLDQMAQKIRD